MESAKTVAERIAYDCKSIAEAVEIIESDRAAIRRECADRAVEYVFFNGDDEDAFPDAPPITSTGLRAAIELPDTVDARLQATLELEKEPL